MMAEIFREQLPRVSLSLSGNEGEKGRLLPRIRKISRTIFLPERVTRRGSRNENERTPGGGGRGWKWARRKMRYERSCCAFPDIRNSIKRVKSNVRKSESWESWRVARISEFWLCVVTRWTLNLNHVEQILVADILMSRFDSILRWIIYYLPLDRIN